jgi:hypothetical protein
METSKAIFPESLVFCGLAERSYLALRKFQKDNELRNSDNEALEDAINFLKNALEGKNAIDNLELSENALVASYAYREALSAAINISGRRKSNSENIISVISGLTGDLEKISKREEIAPENLNNLIIFFSQIRDRTLRSQAGIFDNVVTGSDLNEGDSC